jgi:hypothetical protein
MTKWNKQSLDLIRKLYWNDNLSQAKIAKKFNVCQTVICDVMKKFNIKVKPQGYHIIKHGKSCKGKKYYCKECGNQVSDYRKNYCNDCKQLGERNPAFKGGTTKYYCIKCKNEVSYNTVHYKSGLCKECSKAYRRKHYKKENHPNWKGGPPKCIDCGKKLSAYTAKRCHKCSAKLTARKGKNNNLYGKTPISYKIIWKNNKFKSFWEYRFAMWCILSNIKWEYEPKAFDVKYKKAFKSYTPDFYLPEFDCWIEIKGWWREDSLIKFKKFKIQYKNINIKVFDKQMLKMLGIPCRIKP